MELQADFILGHAPARQARPFDRLFTFLDMLFRRAAMIVEPSGPVWFHRQVGDNEADAGRQLAGGAIRPWRRHGGACPMMPHDT